MTKDFLDHLELNKIHNMDCLEGMQLIPDKSVDMILCDLPYGITDHAWDIIIPFDKLWEQYERIIKDDSAIVLTANLGFTNPLINSNIRLYRYNWVWIKNNVTNFVNAKNRPMSRFEEILVFSKGKTANGSVPKMKYFPQGLLKISEVKGDEKSLFGNVPENMDKQKEYFQEFTNYPNDVLKFNREPKGFHPTQKPVALFEYLIKTYTKKGEVVLDNCMGSGTTAVACINTERKFIGFEINEEYYKKSLERIKNNTTQLGLFE